MFIWTAKLHKGKLAGILAALLVLGIGLALSAASADRTASAVGEISATGIKTAEDRVAYLRAWGWEVSTEPTAVEELALPKEFSEEYTEYLELQSAQGFDLTKYAGKRVKRYSYEVLNHPAGAGVTAHLLLYRNRVVGGELLGEDFLTGLDGSTEQTRS